MLFPVVETFRRKPSLALLCLLYTPCLSAWAQTPPQQAPATASQAARRAEKLNIQLHQVWGQLPDPYHHPSAFGKAAPLLNRAWELVGKWVASYLDEHPGASVQDLVAQTTNALSRREDRQVSLEASAVQLGADRRAAYVVAANALVTGTFFVVARQADGHFRVVWSIKDVARKHLGDELGTWACVAQAFVFNGPLTGTVHQLPPSRSGAARFYVDAQANPASGSNIPKQISIWEWNRKQPVALLIGGYLVTIERAGLAFDGDLLKIETKEEDSMKTLVSCAACTEPEGVWTIQVRPDGVKDLGHRYVHPVYPLIDDLLDRTGRGVDAADIAAPQVVADLRASFTSGGPTTKPDPCPPAFFVEYWGLNHGPTGDHLETSLMRLGCDVGTGSGKHFVTPAGGPGGFSLTIEYRGGKPYVTDGSIWKEREG